MQSGLKWDEELGRHQGGHLRAVWEGSVRQKASMMGGLDWDHT